MIRVMSARETRYEHATALTREALTTVGREIRLARRQHALSQQAVGTAARSSRSMISRVERGLVPQLTLAGAAAMLTAVGLDLIVRAVPGGDPVRDAGHAALLAAFRGRLHPSLRWATEVPLPIPGDRRAWDGFVAGDDWRIGVEAEMRPTDLQALERRLALKQRDGGVDRLILLLPDSAANRRLVRAHEEALRGRFPLAGSRAMALLGAGSPLSADALVILRASRPTAANR
jgi:transcriptional regulator with XRE-family HTH domain